MIYKSYQLDKAYNDNYNFFLFYGKNTYQKNSEFNKLRDEKCEVIKYEEKDLLDKKNEIIENILTKSLFQQKKLILVKRSTDKLLDVVEELVDKNLEDTKIIFESENLEKKSKIRLFFEKNKNCVCAAFYPDNLQTLNKLAQDFLRKRKISISAADINLIVNKCNENRENLLNELEKIKFFMKNQKRITTDQILKLINLSENYSFSELTNNCLAKNKAKTIKIINENNLTNEDCILIIRTLMIKLKRNFMLCNEYQKSGDIDLTISNARPPIFWKDKEITKKQILSWTTHDIKKLIYELAELELIIKKNFNNSVNLITNFIIEVCGSKINN